MVVLLDAPVVAQEPHRLIQVRIVGGDRAGVAERAQVLARVVREAAGDAVGARADDGAISLGVVGAVRLRRILDQRHSGRGRDGSERFELGRPPVEVHRHDRRDTVHIGLERVGVHAARLRIHVDEARAGATPGDRLSRGDERVGRYGDLVSGSDVQGREHQVDRRRAGAGTEAVRAAGEGGEGLLVLNHLAALDEPGVVDHVLHRGVDLGLVAVVRGLQVDEGDVLRHCGHSGSFEVSGGYGRWFKWAGQTSSSMVLV